MEIGKYEVWMNRLKSYVGMANFLMIFYIFLSKSPLGVEWYYWIIPTLILLPILLYIDIKVIFPQTLKYKFNKNPEMSKIKEEIAEIKRILGERYE